MTAEEHPELRSILSINRNSEKPIILIGSGISTDKIDLDKITKQKKYDICAISDAIKIPIPIKYAFQYHWKGLWRCTKGDLERPEMLLTTYKVLHDFERVHKYEWKNKILNLKNVYYFQSNHVKWDTISKGKFDRRVVEPRLQNHEGSVVGVVHFLIGYLGVKNIRYIGFDGGITPGKVAYGSYAYHGRKGGKMDGAAIDYQNSWKTVLKMLDFYKDVKFKPLEEYLSE